MSSCRVAEPGGPVLIDDLLSRAVEHHSERPALDFLGRRWGYRDPERMVARTRRDWPRWVSAAVIA